MIVSGAVLAQKPPSAEKRMNELGPENSSLTGQIGTWDVTETVWASPKAAPIYNRKLVAERKMIGSMLQEIIRPAPGSKYPDFQRIYYLSFNRVEGRWAYVSIDSRAPVGLMPGWSFDRGEKGKIVLTFQPFAIAGGGSEVSGQMLRMDEIISFQNHERNIAEERFMMADGTGNGWLARRYEYVRRR